MYRSDAGRGGHQEVQTNWRSEYGLWGAAPRADRSQVEGAACGVSYRSLQRVVGRAENEGSVHTDFLFRKEGDQRCALNDVAYFVCGDCIS